MSKTDSQRIEELQDHVYALQQLLLSHILAFDAVDREATDATFDIALSQADATLTDGRARVTIRIEAMIEDLKKTRD
ncbi:hypothetical protein ACLBKU_16040 [Erythrobacter sp. NE805]|uniref:hypothetical protein n=1 Tax=Erythrobacter sp. NE805 TaxID=3389875 RepID=UPI00396B2BA1